MELYFSPLACSLATRIALYEAGANARFNQVDQRAKRTADGIDFWAINPLGLVPVLRTDAGELLTENTAILQYVAECHPSTALIPDGTLARARLREWLGFIGTELHKGIYGPLFDPSSADAAKAYARDKIPSRFSRLNTHLSGREFLLDCFSVADAYLLTILNWTVVAGPNLRDWPAVHDYHRAQLARPSVARAVAEERALYAEEQARQSRS
jgi:glutathione S-transferase